MKQRLSRRLQHAENDRVGNKSRDKVIQQIQRAEPFRFFIHHELKRQREYQIREQKIKCHRDDSGNDK